MRHLMLDARVLEAVDRGQFHIHVASHVTDGLALLTGQADLGAFDPSAVEFPPGSLLQRAEDNLRRFRRACRTHLIHRNQAPLRS